MRYGTKEVDWAELGAMMAHADAEEQAEFLNKFTQELRTVCLTSYHNGMQLAAIHERLTKEAREAMEELGPATEPGDGGTCK